ncbi:hypothetical protein ACI3QN_13075, partial [Propionibacterium freudenreichii]|uniref:hypothetical protein n=1 Tax=Propionibacterium freudenreichii TaxID=1744 RepID=UPI003851F1EF
NIAFKSFKYPHVGLQICKDHLNAEYMRQHNKSIKTMISESVSDYVNKSTKTFSSCGKEILLEK